MRRLRRLIAEFARRQGANARALESVNLAVSEAVTNAVLHAYRDADRPGPVLVVATVEGPALLVTVSDDGCGMTARYDSPGGGRGMSIIATLSDTLEIGARAAGRTGVVLRMRFRLSG